MLELLDQLLSYGLFPMALFAGVLTAAAPLEKRKHWQWIALACAAGILFLMFLFSSFIVTFLFHGTIPDQGYGDAWNTVIWCGFLFIAMCLSVLAVCKVSIAEAMYAACCGYLAEHMSYCTRNLISFFTPVSDGGVLYFLLTAASYFLFYRFYVRRIVHESHYAKTVLSSLNLSIAVLTVVLVMSAFATQYDFVTLHSLYALVTGLFVFLSQVNETEKIAAERDLAFRQQLWQRQKAQYEMTKETIDVINRKCHDLRHQVAALRVIEKAREREAVIDSLEEAVMIYDQAYKTGNEVLDTVLTEKGLVCSQNHIALSCIADGSLLEGMNAVDLYTLFGNALDNAIEASMKLPEERRMIDVHVDQKLGLKLIIISNPTPEITMEEGKLPSTSKEDRQDHGFGLLSIKTIVEKYDGVFSVETRDGMFILRCAFQC